MGSNNFQSTIIDLREEQDRISGCVDKQSFEDRENAMFKTDQTVCLLSRRESVLSTVQEVGVMKDVCSRLGA